MYNEIVMAVVMRKSSTIEGEWVAHCLNLDVMSQGPSIQEAYKNIREVIMLTVNDDCENGLDPLERDPAPESDWMPFLRVVRRGKRLSAMTDEERAHVNIVCFQLPVLIPAADCEAPPDSDRLDVPEPWQIAEYEQMRRASVPPPVSSRN